MLLEKISTFILLMLTSRCAHAYDNVPMLCTAKCPANNQCQFVDTDCDDPPCTQIPTCIQLNPGEKLGACDSTTCSLGATCIQIGYRPACVIPGGIPTECYPACPIGLSCYQIPRPQCPPGAFCPRTTNLCIDPNDQKSTELVCEPSCLPGYECIISTQSSQGDNCSTPSPQCIPLYSESSATPKTGPICNPPCQSGYQCLQPPVIGCPPGINCPPIMPSCFNIPIKNPICSPPCSNGYICTQASSNCVLDEYMNCTPPKPTCELIEVAHNKKRA